MIGPGLRLAIASVRLFAVPAFRDFQAALPGWVAEAPVVEQLTPVGSYRVF